MTTAVIFDLYGTLLQLPQDSRPFHQLARRCANADYRSAITAALIQDNPSLAEFASNISLPPQDDLVALESSLDDDLRHVQPFADAIPTLNSLNSHGIKTAVISNLATPYKQPFVDHDLNQIVDVTVFSCDCGLMKPNPEIYTYTLRKLGVTASETVMVGDSFRSDVDGPSRAGITGVHLVRNGGSSRAQSVVSSLQAILQKYNRTTP